MDLRLANLPHTEEDFFILIDSILDTLAPSDELPSERFALCMQQTRLLETYTISRDFEARRNLVIALISLVNNLCERFHIVYPTNNIIALNGKMMITTFDTWHEIMRGRFQVNHYEGIICSACPFSLGPKQFSKRKEMVPCSRNPKLKRLLRPHLCGIISFGDLREEDLWQEIFTKFGRDAWQLFFDKKRKLMRDDCTLIT